MKALIYLLYIDLFAFVISLDYNYGNDSGHLAVDSANTNTQPDIHILQGNQSKINIILKYLLINRIVIDEYVKKITIKSLC